MIKGGTLCQKYIEHTGEDKYTLGKLVFRGIYEDKYDKNIYIKILFDKKEYELTKLLEVSGFTPKVYGYFYCDNVVTMPDYTKEQADILMHNRKYPEDIKDIGELKYREFPDLVRYMVMEKISGKALVFYDKATVEKHIDEIYRLYNVLLDKGYVLNDFAARNIILSDEGKIYFIDFDPSFTKNTLQ